MFVDQLKLGCWFSLLTAHPCLDGRGAERDDVAQTANGGAFGGWRVKHDRPSLPPPPPLTRRDLAAAVAAVHGGYISPFGRHFWNISCSLQATLLPLLSHFLGLLLVCQLLWAARGALDVVTTCAHARCAV